MSVDRAELGGKGKTDLECGREVDGTFLEPREGIVVGILHDAFQLIPQEKFVVVWQEASAFALAPFK